MGGFLGGGCSEGSGECVFVVGFSPANSIARILKCKTLPFWSKHSSGSFLNG